MNSVNYFKFCKFAFLGGECILVMISFLIIKKFGTAIRISEMGGITEFKKTSTKYVGLLPVIYPALFCLGVAITMPSKLNSPSAPGHPGHDLTRILFGFRIMAGAFCVLCSALSVWVFLLLQERLIVDAGGVHVLGSYRARSVPWGVIRDIEMNPRAGGLKLLLREGKPLDPGFGNSEQLPNLLAKRIPLKGSGLELPIELGKHQSPTASFIVLGALGLFFTAVFCISTFVQHTTEKSISEMLAGVFVVGIGWAPLFTVLFSPSGYKPFWVKVTKEGLDLTSYRKTWHLPISEIRDVTLAIGGLPQKVFAEIWTVGGEKIRTMEPVDPVKLMRSIWLAKDGVPADA